LDFQLTINGLDESASTTISEYTKQILISLINNFSIDIEHLSKVIITSDFENELKNVAQLLNKNAIEFTNSNDLRAVAKLITKHEHGKVNCSGIVNLAT